MLLLLLVLLSLVGHHLLVEALGDPLAAVLQGGWGTWLLVLGLLWLFAGADRSR
ncbi:MAG: hypothetical protein ACKOXO_05425 [Cyanobium sp.]